MKIRALLPLLLASASLSHGAIIIGNLAAYNTSDSTVSVINYVPANPPDTPSPAYNAKALGFAMGSTAYTVDSVALRLTGVSNTGTDAPVISIYRANGTGNAPSSTLVGSFINPTFTSALSTSYTFLASGTITLAANTTYFLTVQQLTTTGPDYEFIWDNGGVLASNANTAPTGVGATNGIATFGGGPSVTAISNTNTTRYNWYQINGTAVPEPSAAILALGGVALFTRRNRRS